MILKRLPLHPRPYDYEALSSWIMRIANIYNIEPEDFLSDEFGIELERDNLHLIDLSPSAHLLKCLSERTGVEVDTIRALTAQAYVPLLLDSIEITQPNSCDDYINQFTIFLSERRDIAATGNKLIPWLNINRFANINGCLKCLETDLEPYLRLYWRFSWMMTCPLHNLLLKDTLLYGLGGRKIHFHVARDQESVTRQILNDLCAMDKITLQAVTKGMIRVPSGTLHAGVWLRILRTLVEELNSPKSKISKAERRLILPFWQKFNLSIRKGLGKYALFEDYDSDKQLTLMLVAAAVFASIFSTKTKFFSKTTRLLKPPETFDGYCLPVY